MIGAFVVCVAVVVFVIRIASDREPLRLTDSERLLVELEGSWRQPSPHVVRVAHNGFQDLDDWYLLKGDAADVEAYRLALRQFIKKSDGWQLVFDGSLASGPDLVYGEPSWWDRGSKGETQIVHCRLGENIDRWYEFDGARGRIGIHVSGD